MRGLKKLCQKIITHNQQNPEGRYINYYFKKVTRAETIIDRYSINVQRLPVDRPLDMQSICLKNEN